MDLLSHPISIAVACWERATGYAPREASRATRRGVAAGGCTPGYEGTQGYSEDTDGHYLLVLLRLLKPLPFRGYNELSPRRCSIKGASECTIEGWSNFQLQTPFQTEGRYWRRALSWPRLRQ